MRIELGEVTVWSGVLGEEHRISANLVVDGRVVQTFGSSYIICNEKLKHHGEPDKLRHHVDNRLRNEVTRAIIEYQYGE
ncbi:hypothetical protein [Stenotrophomonas phage BUCT609]|uniref:Uncharacterized protein n=1 Tax=Stenotrophomonas phage BUCT609 TaxID=2834250 RepID=A0A8E6US92_9CAUD|nr:hypothetical protein [Stenotrophomonas phage BUCT609]